MTAYRKKPVVIEAMRFTETTTEDVCNWLEGLVPEPQIGIGPTGALSIATLEGVMRADFGDWIVRGVKGEVYPIKPAIFDATYELAGANSANARLNDAAPDLLAACEATLDLLPKEGSGPLRTVPYAMRVARQVRAAIAKATGPEVPA